MTTSFSDLITGISAEIADTTWDDAYIAYWVNMAIRDYSKYFPLVKLQAITTSLNDNEYDLNTDFLDVLTVEYPDGEDPPAYLSRLRCTHPDFWTADRYYDIIYHNDDTDPAELWISADPAASETINVYYHAHHALIANPASISGNTTIPPIHLHVLTLFVQWQNSLALMNAEQQSPTSNSSLLMAQLSQNSRRLEAAYHMAVRQALYAAGGQSKLTPWIRTGDINERIY